MGPITVKSRKKPHALLAYEALFRQLLSQYRYHKSIVSEYKREKAGYDGERHVDYKLSTYPRKDFFIFRGLRLANPPFHFQMDTLSLTRRFICILEIKNQQGVFKYDSKQRQLTQEIDGKIISYKDPILQAEAQKSHLREWLAMHGIFNIPIETLVVIAYPSTIIENIHDDPDVYNKIIHRESLHEHLDRLNGKYPDTILTNAKLKNISHALVDENTPLRTNPLELHGVSDKHLIKGIPCPTCYSTPMKRLYRNWKCPACLTLDPKAHERIIFDHFLLHQPTITNKICRSLLQIDSPKTAYAIIKSMNLPGSGNNRGRVYYSPSIDEFPQNSSIPVTFHNPFEKKNLE
ncbi:NERD domain-containing protein [Lentibacillus lipolyticus]|nr:NERD domain-containing protein [Lentibacillus lipolyticus]